MSVTSLIQAILIGLVSGLIGYIINHDHFITYFGISMVASLATSVINSKSNPQKGNKRASPSAKTVNNGSTENGTVKWFSPKKGFGFITRENGEEIFAHFRSIQDGGQRGLRDGQRVSFSISKSEKGLQAEDITVIN